LLAWLIPGIGETESWYSLDNITTIGVSLIFFFYGIKLSPRQIIGGLNNYKLHLVVQLSTFILFPVLVIAALPFIKSDENHIMWLSIFFLAALPSTVSSSVVMVGIAKGNISGAIFNASISGLLGIIITPLWMGLFMDSETQGFNLLDAFTGLFIKILLPVIIGLTLHNKLGNIVLKNSKKLAWFDKIIILTIVYKSFSESFITGLFNTINTFDLSILAFSVIALFIVVYFSISKITSILKFSREDRITALFSGSKKSLVHGTVMSKVLFENMASQGIFIIPIMIYHAMQLIVISFIAQKMSKDKV
jgi:sodium/bile acid cotransporter 7